MKHLVTIDSLWLLLLLLWSTEGTDDDVAVLVTRIESSSTYHQRITQHRQHGNVLNRNSNARQHPFLYKKDYKHWLGLKTGPSIVFLLKKEKTLRQRRICISILTFVLTIARNTTEDKFCIHGMANFCPFFFYKFDFVGTFFSSQ
jgi:hypothetical protein